MPSVKSTTVMCLFLISGCTELDYAMQNYQDVRVRHFKHGDATWRIFDKPAEGRLMITPSLGASAGSGAAQGLTLGLAGNPYRREATFRPVVNAYFSATRRNCEIVYGDLVINPQYEFFYECS